jgi:hypothetical protein
VPDGQALFSDAGSKAVQTQSARFVMRMMSQSSLWLGGECTSFQCNSETNFSKGRPVYWRFNVKYTFVLCTEFPINSHTVYWVVTKPVPLVIRNEGFFLVCRNIKAIF